MSLLILRRKLAQTSRAPNVSLWWCRYYSIKTSKPLRVLFCGSDDFSIGSLKALHAEQQRDPQAIASIDVLCRPGKKSGRGLKKIREVPIKGAAQELGLPIHERDTFTGWDLPKPNGESINLIIAVSFGLFVPPRILKSAEYGGLNVHPSILPHLRGPSPLQFTILAPPRETRKATRTGVTLQTLDPKSFDHGIILAQRRYPIPHIRTCTYAQLLSYMTPKAADILVQGIRDRLFVPPLVDVGSPTAKDKTIKHMPAPKVTAGMKQIKWATWKSDEIYRRFRALGPLWTEVEYPHQKIKRWIISDFEVIQGIRPFIAFDKWIKKIVPRDTGKAPEVYQCTFKSSRNVFRRYAENGDGIVIEMCDGLALRVPYITSAGKEKRPAKVVMAELREQWEGVDKGRVENFRPVGRKEMIGAAYLNH